MWLNYNFSYLKCRLNNPMCLFYDLVYLEWLSSHWKTKKLLDILSFGVGRHNLLVSVLRHSAILLGDEKQRKRFWQWGKKNLKYHLLFCVSKFFWGIFLNVFSTVPSCPLMFQSWKLSQSVERATLNKSVWLVTNTTTASKYIPKRTRICIYWNPPFIPHFIKFSKTVYTK